MRRARRARASREHSGASRGRTMVAYLKGVRDWAAAIDSGRDRDAVVEIVMRNTNFQDRGLFDEMRPAAINPNGYVDKDLIVDDNRWYRERGDVALDMPHGTDAYRGVTPAEWQAHTLAARHPDADGYLLSCSNIRALEAVEALEAALDRPVVTSNQAVLWHALRRVGVGEPLPRLGRLGALS